MANLCGKHTRRSATWCPAFFHFLSHSSRSLAGNGSASSRLLQNGRTSLQHDEHTKVIRLHPRGFGLQYVIAANRQFKALSVFRRELWIFEKQDDDHEDVDNAVCFGSKTKTVTRHSAMKSLSLWRYKHLLKSATPWVICPRVFTDTQVWHPEHGAVFRYRFPKQIVEVWA